MLEIFKIFPIYLAILTAILIVAPTFICASIRISLHKHLQNLVKQTNKYLKEIIGRLDSKDDGNIEQKNSPQLDELDQEYLKKIRTEFVNQLEIKFKKASKQLEHVNSLALIDGVYSQEKFNYFDFDLLCENGEYITKTLPNLLLAFGLLGTFLGITSNLYNISQILNKTGSDITDLMNQLQTPLQSMGIAFMTSLIALLCSSFLTVINLKFNTNLAKNKLLTNLEDYLDNIYKPQVEGYTRLDKAVNRMVDQQQEFLLNFHENVGQVLERTFANAANRIADDNEKAQKLATQVYEELFSASSHIKMGADVFKESMVNLENQVNNLQTMMPILERNIEFFAQSANQILTASSKIEGSKFSENLDKTTQQLAEIQAKFAQTTEILSNNIVKFIEENQQATTLAEAVYSNFKSSSEKLEESALIFGDSAEIIKQSKFADNLVTATSSLVNTQQQFYEIAVTLNQGSKPIENGINNLQISVEKMVTLSEEFHNINQNYTEMNDLTKQMITQQEQGWQQTQLNLSQTIATLQKHEQKINSVIMNFAEKIVTHVNDSISSNNSQINSLITTFEQKITLLNENYIKLNNLYKEMLRQQGEHSKQTQLNFSQTMTSLQKHQQNINSAIMNFAEKIVNNMENEINSTNQQFQLLAQDIKKYIILANTLNQNLAQAINGLKNMEKQLLLLSNNNGDQV